MMVKRKVDGEVEQWVGNPPPKEIAEASDLKVEENPADRGRAQVMHDETNETRQAPKHLEIRKDHGLTATWSDGRVSFYPVAHLRKWSPSADARELREELVRNPLTVLPAKSVSGDRPLTIEGVERVGHYAIRLIFSDGHDTGIYSWRYLREIDPGRSGSCVGGPEL